ncbi:hypothetical protein KBC31_04630 [Candidatus Saccharibacteria bacterium]|jgi:hypothetical protein|nr:hypothetical protein [Candidatus Saccharibacteria bacterium]
MNIEIQQSNISKPFARKEATLSSQELADEKHKKIGLTARVLAQERKQQNNPNYMKKRNKNKKLFSFYSAEDSKSEVRAEVKEEKKQTVVEKMLDEGAIDFMLADAMRMYSMMNNTDPEDQLGYKPWWSQASIKEMIKMGDLTTVRHIYGVGG